MHQSHCYQINKIWYFRKKIILKNSNSTYLLRLSIKRLLGKKLYYKLLSKSMLFNFVDYLNINIEEYLNRNIVLENEEIIQFIQELLTRYKKKATVHETGDTSFIDNFGSDTNQVEEKRFKALGFFDDDGKEIGGHTPQALDRELQKINKAYMSSKKSHIANVAKKIIDRQNIINEDELENIPEEYLAQFREALLKIEVSVLHQDMANYNNNIPYTSPSIKKEDTQEQETKVQDKPISIPKKDNWEEIINSYIQLKKSEASRPNTIRNSEINLRAFKELLLGDVAFNIYEKNILDITLNDIIFLNEQIKNLPTLNQKMIREHYSFETKKYNQSIYYLIEKAKLQELQTLSLGGIQGKIKTIKSFILFLSSTNPIYKDLNTQLWDKLSVSQKTLSTKQKEENEASKKLPLLSEDLNAFLIQRYPNTIQGKKNFDIHTSNLPHIFFGFVLNIYMGARAEEIAQLKISDFHKKKIAEETIFYVKIKVTDFDTQSLKNKNATRIVPLHKNIIKLGFLNYLENRIKNKSEWLFDLHINADGKRKQFPKSWNDTFQKWFKKEHPTLIGSPPTFHSLRDHFITKFLKKEKNDSRFSLVNQKKLVGHGAKDIAIDSYYKEDIDLEFAYTLIHDIDFKIEEAQNTLEKLITKRFENILYDISLIH